MKGSPYNERIPKIEGFREDETTTSSVNLHDLNQAEVDTVGSGNVSRSGAESSFNTPCGPSDTEANHSRSPINSYNLNHSSTISSSSSCSSTPTPEKQSRGFSRFFSSKGKNDH
ncbi:hypothetical protein HRI_000953500 [Hibiscus trionum]|uniref:Uncharacterized protein n=1 Tax=Hibiscus trionum TaxID=183268 RepID=A0A9W7H8W1_HIBTR|nr:hypothetical protein HRI_000953100 [Hibiscus trionum]GMI72842.1 hypothetical protein HRI_000953500 [Hibiscus trionum]